MAAEKSHRPLEQDTLADVIRITSALAPRRARYHPHPERRPFRDQPPLSAMLEHKTTWPTEFVSKCRQDDEPEAPSVIMDGDEDEDDTPDADVGDPPHAVLVPTVRRVWKRVCGENGVPLPPAVRMHTAIEALMLLSDLIHRTLALRFRSIRRSYRSRNRLRYTKMGGNWETVLGAAEDLGVPDAVLCAARQRILDVLQP